MTTSSPSPIVGVRLTSAQPARLAAFYGEVFGLTFAASTDDLDTREHYSTDAGAVHFEIVSGPDHEGDDLASTPVLVSFGADDVDEVYERALNTGGFARRPPTDYPWGRFAEAIDPHGNHVGIYQTAKARV